MPATPTGSPRADSWISMTASLRTRRRRIAGHFLDEDGVPGLAGSPPERDRGPEIGDDYILDMRANADGAEEIVLLDVRKAAGR